MKNFFEGIKHYIILFVAFIFLGTLIGMRFNIPLKPFTEATSSVENVDILIKKNDNFCFDFLPNGNIKNIKTNYGESYDYPDTFMNIGFKINGYVVPVNDLRFEKKEDNKLVAIVTKDILEDNKPIKKTYEIVLNYDNDNVLPYETRFNYKCFEILPNDDKKNVDLTATLLLQSASNSSDLKMNDGNIITFDSERYKHSLPANSIINIDSKNGFGMGLSQNKHFLYLKFPSGWSNIKTTKSDNSVQLYCEEIKNFSGFSLYGGPLDLKFLQQYKIEGLLNTGLEGATKPKFVKKVISWYVDNIDMINNWYVPL
jgi:hypothetical protein